MTLFHRLGTQLKRIFKFYSKSMLALSGHVPTPWPRTT